MLCFRKFEIGLARQQRFLGLSALDVVGHKAVCRLDDGGRAAVIGRELYELGGKIGAETLDLPEAGAIPLIDDLIVVRDREYVAEVIARHGADQAILCVVRILKLV